MFYFVTGTLILIVGLMFLSWLANAKPKIALKGVAFVIMVFCIGLAALFMMTGRWGLSLPSFMGAWIAFQRYRMVKGVWSSFKGWQGSTSQNEDQGRPRAGRMSKSEALEVLGLESGATETDIKQAHKKLMFKMHPDKGGTPFFASQLNEAKDTLLRD
jgi:hypothetical protein